MSLNWGRSLRSHRRWSLNWGRSNRRRCHRGRRNRRRCHRGRRSRRRCRWRRHGRSRCSRATHVHGQHVRSGHHGGSRGRIERCSFTRRAPLRIRSQGRVVPRQFGTTPQAKLVVVQVFLAAALTNNHGTLHGSWTKSLVARPADVSRSRKSNTCAMASQLQQGLNSILHSKLQA